MRSFVTWSQMGNRRLVTQLFLVERGLPPIYCHKQDRCAHSVLACARRSAKTVQRRTTANVNTTAKKLHSGCTALYSVVLVAKQTKTALTKRAACSGLWLHAWNKRLDTQQRVWYRNASRSIVLVFAITALVDVVFRCILVYLLRYVQRKVK